VARTVQDAALDALRQADGYAACSRSVGVEETLAAGGLPKKRCRVTRMCAHATMAYLFASTAFSARPPRSVGLADRAQK
jgi:hypothetical protein